MIDTIIGVISSDLFSGVMIGALSMYIILLIRSRYEQGEKTALLAEMVVLMVHLRAFSHIMDEEQIDPERVEEKIEEQLDDERVVDAFIETGRL